MGPAEGQVQSEPVDTVLSGLIADATADSFDRAEEAAAFFAKLEENLELPFTTSIAGSQVTVHRLELRGEDEIVAVFTAGTEQHTRGILEIPLPDLPPRGAEWVEAYRCWISRSQR